MSICPQALHSSKPKSHGKPQSITRLLQKKPSPMKVSVYSSYEVIYFWKLLSILVKWWQTSMVHKRTKISLSPGNKEKDSSYHGILIFSFSLLLHCFFQLYTIGKSCTVCSGKWSSTLSLGKSKAIHDFYYCCNTRREPLVVMSTVWGFQWELRGN